MNLTIPSRYNGPDGSANGGYTCGQIAKLMNCSSVEVTLRKPPPLDLVMDLVKTETRWELQHTDGLVATAIPAELELEVPEAPSLSQAEAARAAYTGHQDHPFPRCFVCGPNRQEGDGLRVFAGPVKGTNMVATRWTPHRSLADAQGNVHSEFLWCALDCPGAFGVDQKMETPRVLGRLTGHIVGKLKAEHPAIVVGWPLGVERRKAFAGTAIFDSNACLIASARAVWIAI